MKDVKRIFNDDTKRLKNVLKHPYIMRAYNTLILDVIRLGLLADKMLPYALAFVLLYSSYAKSGDAPFKLDEKQAYIITESIRTQDNKLYLVRDNYFVCTDDYIECSTAWMYNPEGFYERYVTEYKVILDVDNIDVTTLKEGDIPSLDCYSREDKRIVKDKLDALDHIYDEDCIVLKTYDYSIDTNNFHKESKSDNIFNSFIFSSLVLLCGYLISSGQKLFIEDIISDKLGKLSIKYRELTLDELHNIQDILKVKEKNIEIINGNKKIDTHGYSLRR